MESNKWNYFWITLKHISGVYSFLTSGSSLISGLGDGSILIRDQTSFDISQTIKQHKSTVRSLILLDNGNLASGSYDTQIIV